MEINRRTVPPFNQFGVLPPGDYELTVAGLKSSVVVKGGASPGWDASWRAELVDRLSVLADQLWQVGIESIFINGSFVEDKDHPNDIDGYFECDLRYLASGELERALNLLDPKNAWTWDPASRRPYAGYAKRQLPMWHLYRVELYPHYGQSSGIVDEHGNDLEFPAAFRRSRRSGQQKGIIKLIREEKA